MAVLRGGLGGPWLLPDFWLPPCLPPVFCLISRSSSFDWHIQQITSASKILNDLKTFWRRFWRYSQAYVGFNRFSKSIFITMENHHERETFMLAPLLFPRPRSTPHFFHSRIATETPVSHPLTRLIHISPNCWTIYRLFEITLEMGTVHWVELQIQCSIQIHCFKKTFSPIWIMF